VIVDVRRIEAVHITLAEPLELSQASRLITDAMATFRASKVEVTEIDCRPCKECSRLFALGRGRASRNREFCTDACKSKNFRSTKDAAGG
jgi:hypothetical protein